MRAYVLSIGSEMMLGHLTDTNATYLAQELSTLGIELVHVTQVGDDRPRLVATLRHALDEADVVICTGGVGPTDDDLTREAIAEVAGETPVVDERLAAEIEAFFHARGLQMPERNRKQAWLIPSAEPLPNPVGTAPGWFVRTGGKIIVAMPGVPREMFRMWREQAIPRLISGGSDRVVRSITIRTIGIGESAAEQQLLDLVQALDPVVATYAKDDGVQIRVTAVSPTDEEATARRDATATEVIKRLERYVYGFDDTSLAEAVIQLLKGRGFTVAVGEVGSGGRFGSFLADQPTSIGVLRGAVLFGDDSREPLALADSARSHFGSDVGVGIRIDSTPASNGVYEGTISIAVSGAADAASTEQIAMKTGFEDSHRRAAMTAADMLRRALKL
jgi:nicotinamide-nucleotide amidase